MHSFTAEVVGILQEDAGVKVTGAGKEFVTLRVAVFDGYADQKHTTYLNVVCWDSYKVGLYGRLTKDTLVFIKGTMRGRSWEAREGGKRYELQMSADFISSIEMPPAEPGEKAYAPAEKPPAGEYKEVPAEDDLPF